MPYIPIERRKRLRPEFRYELAEFPAVEGELNYIITMTILDYLEIHGVSYSNINAAIGALECAKLELYRRVAVPYEQQKMKENGDVYDSQG